LPFSCLAASLFLLSSCSADQARRYAPAPFVPTARPIEPFIEAVVNKEYLATVLSMIAGAKESIRIVHFECNEDYTIDRIVKALEDAHKRGVDVVALFEADVEGNTRRAKALVREGIAARVDSSERYTHAKLVVADGVEALFGSTNFSYKSIRYNNETNLHIVSAPVGAYFKAYAEAVYADPDATPEIEPVSVPEIGLVSTLHEGDYFPAALQAVEGAKERIHLLVYGMHLNAKRQDSKVVRLVKAMQDAVARGVDVRVILEASDYNEDLNRLNTFAAEYMAKGCIKVRFEPLDQISHAKLLITDSTAFVGSNNWGEGGFGRYHEVGGITTNSGVLAELSLYFDSIWDDSTPAASPCLQ